MYIFSLVHLIEVILEPPSETLSCSHAGNEDKFRVTIEYARKFQSPLGVWTVPLHRGLQCPSRAAYLRVNGRLMRHFSEEGCRTPATMRSALDSSIPDLSIVDAPYRTASRQF